ALATAALLSCSSRVSVDFLSSFANSATVVLDMCSSSPSLSLVSGSSAGELVLARLHDQGLGLFRGLASDVREFVDGQVGQFVARVHAGVSQLANELRVEPVEIAQVLRDFLDALLAGDFHGQERILGARAQFIDGV